MSRKKKGEKTKTDEAAEIESAPEAAAAPAPAPKKAAAPAKKAAEKANEVIPAVRVALLEQHAELPDKEIILLAFAEHYRDAQTRASAAAEEAKRVATPAAEAPKSRRTRYVTNPQIPTAPASGPRETMPGSPPPYIPPTPPAFAAPAYVEPAYTEAESAYEPEPIEPIEMDQPTPGPDAAVLMDDEGTPSPQVAFGKDLGDSDLFGESPLPSEDDIFGALGKSTASKDEELGFAPSSEYSDPFIRTAASSEPSDPFMPSFEQVQSAPVEQAEPMDRTMMIPAYVPPDEEAAAEAEAEAQPEADAQTGRKGRRASKKKK